VFCRERDTCVANGDAKTGVTRVCAPQKDPGTAAAKDGGMLTVSAFVILLGSVFTSVLWACKEDVVDRA
jgi:hypothetical protein